MLHEDDLPELDDYETGFSAGETFDSVPQFSAQRRTTTERPVGRFDQFIAASTARPVIVTAPSAGRWRGSTVTGTGATEPSRFLPRQNSLDRGSGKRVSSDRTEEARERLRSPVSGSVEKSSQVFDNVDSQSLQGQVRSDGKPDRASENVEQNPASTGSQSFRRTSERVTPTSAPAGSQTFERTSRRFNSLSSFVNNPQDAKPPSSQKTSGRTTLTAAITVVDDSALSGPAVRVVPTAAALTSDAATTRRSRLSNTVRPESSGGERAPSALSRVPTPARLTQSQPASRSRSQSASRAQFQTVF